MTFALLKNDKPLPIELSKLTDLEKLRLLAVEERRKLIRLVQDFDDPIEQGRAQLAQILKESDGQAPLQENVSSMEDLLRLGQSVKPYFDSIVQTIANATHGHTIFPGLKSGERIMSKVKGEYKEVGYKGIRDVVRASIVFDDLQSLYQAVEHLYGSVEIVFVEDRFLNPTAAGYSDMKLYISLPAQNGKPFITELQLHLPEMLAAKKIETELYEKRRELENQYEKLPEDSEIKLRLQDEIAFYRAQGKALYQEAAQKYHLKKSNGTDEFPS